MSPQSFRRPRSIVLALLSVLLMLLPTAAVAHPELTGDPDHDDDHQHDLRDGSLDERDASDHLEDHDAATAGIISEGPTGKKIKDMALAGRGERLVENATTDVWALGNYAYIGTFNEPCGTGENYVEGVGEVDLVDGVEEPGIAIFDIRNPNKPRYVGNLPSVEGSRTNDVKVYTASDGTDILVHSNEACGGGKGGFEIYDVSDPTNPVHLASVQIDELNPISDFLFGGITDVGVHNLFLFSQGDRDYVAVVAETAFDTFQIYEITDPTSPTLVTAWGAEEVFDPGVGDLTDLSDPDQVDRVLDAALWLLDGPGSSQNRFLHDLTINEDGTRAYLSNWDAGLILLDISDPANPVFVSQAINLEEGSLDGELNSHAAWPSEDGSIVVETEEDFDAWEGVSPPQNLTLDGTDTPGDPTIPATALATNDGDFFEQNQTGLTGSTDGDTVVVDGGPTFDAVELSTPEDSPSFEDTGTVSGEFVWIGRACTVSEGDELLNTEAFDEGDIAVVRRGDCEFEEKANAAASLGASAVIIANNLEGTPWGGVRIWDYSDPEDPVLASTFYTECSAASEPIEGCDPAGTYSVHNVQVESRGSKTYAYISWYWDGMVVLDVTDPYNPVEVARFFDNSEEFIAANGGNPHDFWGVYKIENEPWVFGSDRNGGLYVFKLTGKGRLN
ncbi:MAG TPA: PA domain-containing protein [Euzebyales bacterium]